MNVVFHQTRLKHVYGTCVSDLLISRMSPLYPIQRIYNQFDIPPLRAGLNEADKEYAKLAKLLCTMMITDDIEDQYNDMMLINVLDMLIEKKDKKD